MVFGKKKEKEAPVEQEAKVIDADVDVEKLTPAGADGQPKGVTKEVIVGQTEINILEAIMSVTQAINTNIEEIKANTEEIKAMHETLKSMQ